MELNHVYMIALFGTGGLLLVQSLVNLRANRHRWFSMVEFIGSVLLLVGAGMDALGLGGVDGTEIPATAGLLGVAGFVLVALGTTVQFVRHTHS